MSAQREAFEVWAKKKGLTLDSEKCLYLDFYTAIAWTAWQAAQAAMPVDPDAARYQWLREGTRGARDSLCQAEFDMPWPTPIGNIMQGSVAQHLDAAIDAEMSRTGGKS